MAPGMTHFATASRSFAFDMRLGQCAPGLQTLLKEKMSVKPAVFAHVTREAPGTTEASEVFRSYLVGLGVEADVLETWVTDCSALHSIAHGEMPAFIERTANLSGEQQTADLLELEDSNFVARERDDSARASLLALAHLLAEWKGKRYRRTAGQPSAHAREEGERSERLRQGRQVAGILVEADLPFAASIKHRAQGRHRSSVLPWRQQWKNDTARAFRALLLFVAFACAGGVGSLRS